MRQRGVAAVTAILIVAVAAAAASFMLAQQSAMLGQTALVASRAQADLYGRAGLDWARGVLADDAKRAGDVDWLGEGWAQPLAALPVERAVVAGAIADEQGKFNLNNLLNGTVVSEQDMAAFKRLLESVGLPGELREAVLDWIDANDSLSGGAGAESPYYLSLAKPYRAADRPMVQLEELYRVRGFDAQAVAKLRPYVTALPAHTKVNVNTASPQVLAAMMPELSAAQIADIVRARQAKPFRTTADVTSLVKNAQASVGGLDVKSNFYSVRVTVTQDDVQVASESLVQRDGGKVAVLWRRTIY